MFDPPPMSTFASSESRSSPRPIPILPHSFPKTPTSTNIHIPLDHQLPTAYTCSHTHPNIHTPGLSLSASSPDSLPSPIVATPSRPTYSHSQSAPTLTSHSFPSSSVSGRSPRLCLCLERETSQEFHFAAPLPPAFTSNSGSDLGSPIKMHHHLPNRTQTYGIAGGLILHEPMTVCPSPTDLHHSQIAHDVFGNPGGGPGTIAHLHHQQQHHPHALGSSSSHILAPLKPSAQSVPPRSALRATLSHNAVLDNVDHASNNNNHSSSNNNNNNNSNISPNTLGTGNAPTSTTSMTSPSIITNHLFSSINTSSSSSSSSTNHPNNPNPSSSSWNPHRRVMAPVLNAQTVDSNGATTHPFQSLTSNSNSKSQSKSSSIKDLARINNNSSSAGNLPPVDISRTTSAHNINTTSNVTTTSTLSSDNPNESAHPHHHDNSERPIRPSNNNNNNISSSSAPTTIPSSTHHQHSTADYATVPATSSTPELSSSIPSFTAFATDCHLTSSTTDTSDADPTQAVSGFSSSSHHIPSTNTTEDNYPSVNTPAAHQVPLPPSLHPLHSTSFDSGFYPIHPIHPSWAVGGYSAPAFDIHHPLAAQYQYRFMSGMHQALLKPVEPILAPGEMPAPRPTQSYAALIGEALLLSPPPHQLYVSEISESIKKRYAYYRQNPSKIYNGVRHQTSMCKAFVKLPRPFGDQSGGARKWAIREGCETWFRNGGFYPPPNHSTPTTTSSGHKRGGGGSGGSGVSGAGSSGGSGGKAKAAARAKQLAIGTGSVSPSIKRQALKSDEDEWPGSGGPSTGRAWDPYSKPHPYTLPPTVPALVGTTSTSSSGPTPSHSTPSAPPAFSSAVQTPTQPVAAPANQPYFQSGYHYPAFAPLPPSHLQQQPSMMPWGAYQYPSNPQMSTSYDSHEGGWRMPGSVAPHLPSSSGGLNHSLNQQQGMGYDMRPRTISSSDGSHFSPEVYAARPPPPSSSGQDMSGHRGHQAHHHQAHEHSQSAEYGGGRSSASPMSHGAHLSSHGASPIDV